LLLSPNKIERLKRIIIEAVEQSGRHKVPEFIVLDKIPFDEMKGAENICFHTSSLESIAIKNLKLDYTKKVNIFI
jgi:16S rRNA U1498 N3-methylase RsmE